MDGFAATIGTFDGVHLGHRHMLSCLSLIAHERNLRSMVVTFSKHPLEEIRPDAVPPLLTSAYRRVELLRADKNVDAITVLDFDTSIRSLTAAQFMQMLAEKYNVRVLLMGYDHSFGSDCIHGIERYVEIGKQLGIEVIQATPLSAGTSSTSNISSSSIRQALLNGDIDMANAMLGRNFELEGTVVSGKKLGRTIGFPTANISVDQGMLIPASGVYACKATLPDGSTHTAVVNIGNNPTVNRLPARETVEAHIIGWQGDLYGLTLRLEFMARLRGEIKFESLEQLKRQIAADCHSALNLH